MPRVKIKRGTRSVQVEVNKGSTLLHAIQKAEMPISMPCGGNHKCNKCVVIAQGTLSTISKEEKEKLKGKPDGSRMACYTIVQGDCSVVLETASQEVIKNAYSNWEGKLSPLYTKGYGVSFDIGTTTVSGQLFSNKHKKPLAVIGEVNKQRVFGGDVLSRISYANEHSIKLLSDVIRQQISSMIVKLCTQAKISPKEVNYMVACGNSVMLYILVGLEVRTLAMTPFTMTTHFKNEYSINIPKFPNLLTYLPGCASAYIGADTTCSVLASNMIDSNKNIILIDVGTNGEMVLHTKNKDLICCSTAAGPAFEGAGIACGGSASTGAINYVDYVDGELYYTTIDNAPADKICGSGLIDGVAALLDMGIVNENGRMDKKYKNKAYIGDTDIYITQNDIRQFQLAKAAIRAGIETLLHESKTSFDDVDEIILCGGFGSYLRPESAERVGLFPNSSKHKITVIGNAAGNGSGQILQSKLRCKEAETIFGLMKTIDLVTTSFFTEKYIYSTRFPKKS